MKILPSNVRNMLVYAVGMLAVLFALIHAGGAQALNVSSTMLQVQVGNTANVTVTDASGEVRVSSSNNDIATVKYEDGVARIRGRAAGSATVTIRDRQNSRQVSVTVTSAPALTVSPTSVQVQAGNTANVTVTNASGEVRVSSSNTDVTTANYENGVVRIRGRAAGSATVTVRDSRTSRQVSVTVTSAPALTVSPTSVQVQVGNTANVTVTNASGEVRVSSSNNDVATASYENGVVRIRGRSPGSATVTVRDSRISRQVSVTVTSAPALTVSPASVQVQAGNTANVTVTNASGEVRVSSSNTDVATVSYENGVAIIRGRAAGSATVTVRDSRTSRQVAVTVTSAAALTVSPTSVQVLAGNTATVSVTNASGAVTAISSNTAIATVTYASGIATIRGVAAGTATITISDSVNSRTVAVTVTAAVTGDFTLLAWNNLGMHCYDGNDYSIFSILPPLNTVNAQVVNKATGDLVTSGITLTYQATADTRGSINTISSTKTNFWQYVQVLFGLAPEPDVGLLGYPMASNTPAPMAYNAEHNWFEAVGIPITNVDDTNAKNDYPMVQIVAKNTSGQVLASTRVVLPVSDMLDCRNCHTSNTSGNAAANAAKPAAGWVFDADPLKDWKRNILRLHDERQAGNATYASALQAKGYPDGLYNSAMAGKPVLCVACHVSNAYQIEAGFPTGMDGIPPLTQVIHGLHASQVDPDNGMTLDDINNRNSCYHCHPGSVTQCLRGAMSGPNYQCQSCHSKMSHVGSATRSGWLSEPDCQSCHHDGKREAVGVDSQGLPLAWSDTRFATTPNVPSAGFRLYRFSTGHGGLKCSACHGSTHAEYPSTEANDNVQSIAVQGYAGTVQECTACHASVPNTVNGGPHGMHPIGNQWVSRHKDVAENANARIGCAYCHGADFRGSPLSRVKVAKTVGSHSYAAGQMVTCYDCHNGPTGGSLEPATKFAKGNPGFIESLGNFFGELVAGMKSFLSEIGSKIFQA